MSKHTPGPWFIDTSLHVYGSSEPRQIDGVPGGTVIDNPHVCTAKTCADAILIAASPELLEAIVRLEFAAQCRDNTMGDPCRLIAVKAELAAAAAQARAAIAKATGG